MSDSADEESADEIADALLRELQRVAEENGGPPSKNEFDELSSHNPQTYVSEFGSWVEALEAADLEPEKAQGGRQKTDEKELLDELENLHEELDRVPRAADMNALGSYSAHTYRNRFGSWNEALDAVGLEAQTRPKVTREELIEGLQQLADTLGHPPRPGQMDSEGEYASETYRQRFGSWQEALDAAGFEPFTGVSDEELLHAIRTLTERLDSSPTTTEFNKQTPHSASTCIDRFGSWPNSLEAAGVDSDGSDGRQQYSDEELVDELTRLEGRLDHTPSTTEMDEEGEYSASVYQHRFGSWEEALEEADMDGSDSRQQYTTDELIIALQELNDEIGDVPRAIDMQERGDISPTTFTNRFGSWNEALEAAGLDVEEHESGTKYTEEALLEELRRLTDTLGKPPTSTEMERQGKHSSSLYLQRFDSWDDALEAAGLDSEETGASQQYSREELLDEIRRLADELDSAPTTTDMEREGKYSYTTYASRFESWEKALEEAGVVEAD